MKLTSRTTLCAVLAAAFFLATASPSDANISTAESLARVARGHGTWGSSPTLELIFAVKVSPHDQVGGFAISRDVNTQGFFHMDVTSMMFLGGRLAFAGPITMQANSPFPVGATAFFFVEDNGDGTLAPDRVALGVAPLSLGNLTIQQIVAMIGPPPPNVWALLLTGDIWIF